MEAIGVGVKMSLDETDPFVMYLAVNLEAGMGPGKIAAQVGHGVQMQMQQYWDCQIAHLSSDFKTWLCDGKYRKIVLGCKVKDWAKLKEINGTCEVVDAGLTEVSVGTATVLSFWPTRKSQAPKLLKRLRLLP